MADLRSYLDDQKPSQLACYQANYQAGAGRWNNAVTIIWTKAGQPPPTV